MIPYASHSLPFLALLSLILFSSAPPLPMPRRASPPASSFVSCC
jgi:hypothetical protein